MQYDRPYMRAPERPNMRSAAMVLLLINVGVFLLMAVLTLAGLGGVRGWFDLDPYSLFRFQFWTPLTYAFLHGSLFHIAINMFVLYMVGRPLEATLGRKNFLELYFAGIFGGAVAYLLVHLGAPGLPVVGASAAVIALVTFMCLRQPEATFLLIFPPIPVKAKYLLWFLLAWDGMGLLFSELPMRFGMQPAWTSGISHSAHLGGILAAWLYSRSSYSRDDGARPSVGVPEWMRKKHRKGKVETVYKVNVSTKNKPTREEVDRILDKISEEGFGSLTKEERATLERHRSRK